MPKFRGENREMEKRLRRERPAPSEDLIRQITGQVSAGRRRQWNLGLAFGLTLVLAGAFALTGGVRYAASAVTDGTRSITHLIRASNTSKSTLSTSKSTPSTKNGDKGSGDDKGGGDKSGKGGGKGSGDDQYGTKVLMCHHPPRKNPVTISVAQSAVPAHLKQGDTLGACKT